MFDPMGEMVTKRYFDSVQLLRAAFHEHTNRNKDDYYDDDDFDHGPEHFRLSLALRN